MKPKNDWIAITAAASVGFFGHIVLTADSIIFPAFVGVIMLNFLVVRLARPS